MSETTDETSYETIAAKVKAAGLKISSREHAGIYTVWGRGCVPHHYNEDRGWHFNIEADDDWDGNGIEDCIAAVLATEPPQAPAGREQQLGNAVTFMIRLSRALPRDHPVRIKALCWLDREGLMPSVLRTPDEGGAS